MTTSLPSFVSEVFVTIPKAYRDPGDLRKTRSASSPEDVFLWNRFGLVLAGLKQSKNDSEMFKRWVATCVKISHRARMEQAEERYHLNKPGWSLGAFMRTELRKAPKRETQRVRDIEVMLGANDMWDFAGRLLRISNIFDADFPAREVGQVLYLWGTEPHTRYLTVRNFWEGFHHEPFPNSDQPS